jgi:hypothetical protein
LLVKVASVLLLASLVMTPLFATVPARHWATRAVMSTS